MFGAIEAGTHDLPCQERTIAELKRRLDMAEPDHLERMANRPLSSWKLASKITASKLDSIRRAGRGAATTNEYVDTRARAQWIFSVAPILVPSCMIMRQPLPQPRASQPPSLKRDASHGEDVSHVGFPAGPEEQPDEGTSEDARHPQIAQGRSS